MTLVYVALSLCRSSPQHCLQKPVEGIRDRLYGFVKFCPKHVEGQLKGEVKTDMALDISFGSSGYALVLSRAFKTVSHYFATTHACVILASYPGPLMRGRVW